MEDRDIVTLYWQRDQEAIRQTDRQYGRYLSSIAFHILADREDSRETVNDTYLRAWDSMPPHRPQVLSTYLGRITRQLSIDRWRARGRVKRGGSQYALSLEELGDCLSGAATPAKEDSHPGGGPGPGGAGPGHRGLSPDAAASRPPGVSLPLLLCRLPGGDGPGLRHQRTGGQESAVPHPPGSADVSGKGGL